MTPSSPSRLPLLAALCIGIAIGALVISALNSQPRTVPRELEPGDQDAGQIERLVESIEAQTEAITRLETLMHEVLNRRALAPSAMVESQESGRHPIEPEPESVRTEQRDGDAANWLAARDKDIIRLLVRRGVTPYDPGVAVHVKTAAKALQKIAADYRVATTTLVNDVFNGLITSREQQESTKLLEKKRGAERKEILNQLGASLDALSKGAGAGEDG